jgi:hypothetical protein
MQTLTILEAQQLLSFAEQTLAALRTAEERLASDAQLMDERAWLVAASRRVIAESERTRQALAGALALPEFEAERQARGQALFNAWLDAVEALLAGITAHVSAGSPLIEVLFPHQKFEKLRRGGATARAYMLEFERRRTTAYVLRLATEPEYAFLPPLLSSVDQARAQLANHEQPDALEPGELDALRTTVLLSADALQVALTQARLLADAALIGAPGLVRDLGLDAKPRKRAARSATPQAEPV